MASSSSSSATTAPLALQGTLCHTPHGIGSVEVLQQHLVVVDAAGFITFLGPADDPAARTALLSHGLQPHDVRVLSPSQFLLPGFCDLHFHAPQYQFVGLGTDLPLFEWLQTYTFPCESQFADVTHAELVYRRAVTACLRHGTTTCNYFTTLHVEACKVLADVVEALGQRAVIGKCCMDQHSPEHYTEPSAAHSLQGAREVVAYIKAKGCSRLTASVIPRFIPTCSQQLLEGLGQLVQDEEGLLVHSHISESIDQVEFSQQLHPGAAHDADIYAAAGLLTSRSVFAHGTQLTVDALKQMAAKGAAVAHCPLSNFYFGDGLFCVAKAVAHGVKVGLGTDVAGGYTPSMLQAIRMAVVNSHALKAAALMPKEPQEAETPQQAAAAAQQEQAANSGQAAVSEQGAAACDNSSRQPHGATAGLAGSRVASSISSPAVSAAALQHMLSWEDALYLATAGGAGALGLGNVVGHFGIGMAFDALLVDCGQSQVFDVLLPPEQQRDSPLALLELFVHLGDDRSILEVWVQGRPCKPSPV